MKSLGIDGAWVLEPAIFPDERGSVHEWFRGTEFREATGHDLALAQANCSASRRGVLRGIHFAEVPPGQAKHVTCTRGAVLDIIVDIRVGSPTFGEWESVHLDDQTGRAVYVSEGLGHGFLALSDATVMYLCSAPYTPDREHGVNPFDPALGISWPAEIAPILSPKDAAAPTLAEAEQLGLLPSYAECQAYRAALREPRQQRTP